MKLDFNMAKDMAIKYAKKFNKQVVAAKENAEYWYFEADSDELLIDDGAGSCHVLTEINHKKSAILPI